MKMSGNHLISQLKRIVGSENVLFSEMDLTLYGYDASLERGLPDAVVIPGSTEEVARVAATAYGEGVPIVARGSGTNLSGGSVPSEGGIVIHFSHMNRILEIDEANRTVTVEPGVITLHLQNTLLERGLMYAPDPASQKVSTIGGNFGENSGGPHCLKYGVTTNNLLGAEVVLYDGTVIWTGGKSPEQPGYDLTGLLVGSEGTLGIATKVILKVLRPPEAVKTLLAIFDSIEDAGNTVSAIIAEGIVPATLEMMDQVVMGAVEASIKAGYPLDAAAVLIIELDGMKDGLERQAEKILKICEKNHVRTVTAARDNAERARLWAGRKGAFGAMTRLKPSYLVCDGTVPRTRLPEVLRKVRKAGEDHGVLIGNVFHAGDGNLHPLLLFDERDADELRRVKKVSSEILKICADAGGTISGEHGIGLEKLREMSFIFSEADFEAMRRVKRAFDPEEVLNPGKLIPTVQASGGSA